MLSWDSSSLSSLSEDSERESTSDTDSDSDEELLRWTCSACSAWGSYVKKRSMRWTDNINTTNGANTRSSNSYRQDRLQSINQSIKQMIGKKTTHHHHILWRIHVASSASFYRRRQAFYIDTTGELGSLLSLGGLTHLRTRIGCCISRSFVGLNDTFSTHKNGGRFRAQHTVRTSVQRLICVFASVRIN